MILDYRQKLRIRLADSLTEPNFEALTTLDGSKGQYLSIESIIREGSKKHGTIEMEFKRHTTKPDWIDYTLTLEDQKYSGHINLINIEEKGVEAEAEVHLERRGISRVASGSDKRTKEIIGMDCLRQIQYWVPTIINHVAKNANSYLKGYRLGVGSQQNGDKKTPGNTYKLVLEEVLDKRSSPKTHFRDPHERRADTITVRIRGTYVKPAWDQISEKDVLESISEHAGNIDQKYFIDRLLPDLIEAGHNGDRIQKAYEKNR